MAILPMERCVDLLSETFQLEIGGEPVFNVTTGRYAQPTSPKETISIRGVVYPTSARESSLLPEGVRNKSLITIFTRDIQLKNAGQGGDSSPYVLLYRDNRWEVFQTEDWLNTGGYFKSIAMREGV